MTGSPTGGGAYARLPHVLPGSCRKNRLGRMVRGSKRRGGTGNRPGQEVVGLVRGLGARSTGREGQRLRRSVVLPAAFFSIDPVSLFFKLGRHLRQRGARIFVSGPFGEVAALFGPPAKPS